MKIEKGFPVPEKKYRETKQAPIIRQMEIGDSIFFNKSKAARIFYTAPFITTALPPR